MPDLKPFLCFDCQVNLMKSRDIIDDTGTLKQSLKNINYYHFSGLLLKYKNFTAEGKETYNSLKISTVYDLQEADLKLRMLLFEIIGHVELSLRTYLAYTFAKQYGTLGYLCCHNFKNKTYSSHFIKILETRMKQNDAVRFIRHHKINKDGKLPIWVVVELLTFENLMVFYNNLYKKTKDEIQKYFVNISPQRFEKWLEQLKNLRNECAHIYRIYDGKRESILIPNAMKIFILSGTTWEKCSSTLFGYICVMKFIINNTYIWDDILTQIQDYFSNYGDIITPESLGFPENWYDVLDSII